MSLLLHIETSGVVCSVALSEDDHLIHALELDQGLNHTANLAPLIERLLIEASIDISALSAVIVNSGPGSYTGLRVGTSTSKALAYSQGLPMVGVPALKALATEAFQKHPQAEVVVPMIDARRQEVYLGVYSRQGEILPATSFILNQDMFGQLSIDPGMAVACGDGAFKMEGLLKKEMLAVDEGIVNHARLLVRPGLEMWRKGETADAMHFVPFYLKPPNITQQKALLR